MNYFEDSDDTVVVLLVLSAIRANDAVWFERLTRLPRLMTVIKDSAHCHMLHECARRNRVAFAEFFLRQGVAVDDRDENGATPLGLAQAAGHSEMVACLMHHGATSVLTLPGFKHPTAHSPTQLPKDSLQPLAMRSPTLASRFNGNTRALAR